MASTLPIQRIRVKVDVTSFEHFKDVLTNLAPGFWDGNDLRIELALFKGAALLDISNISQLQVDVKSYANLAAASVMQQISTTFNPALLLEDWQNDVAGAYHCAFTFLGSETAVGTGAVKTEFWLIFSGKTTDSPAKDLTYGRALCIDYQDGVPSTPTAPLPADDYYTKTSADARFVRKDGTSQNIRISGGIMQWKHPVSGLWHAVILETTPDGVIAMSLNQTGVA